MAWAAVGTVITPKNQWQFTAPIEGEFFRLKHTRSPNEPKAWICQAEKLEDDSYQIYDIQPVHANNSTESFQLKKPAIFTSRCIGFRYAVDYNSPWRIALEVSDIYTPVASSNPSQPPAIQTYKDAVLADKPIGYWRLGETSGNRAIDISGNSNTGTYLGGYTLNQFSSLNADTDPSVSFDGSTGWIQTTIQYANPQAFTLEARFKTNATAMQGLFHFGANQGVGSATTDRNLYLTNDGKLNFYIFSGRAYTLTTPGSYNDGAWHSVAATFASTGIEIYVDGKLVINSVDPSSAAAYNGFWHIGYVSQSGNYYINGGLDEVAIYDKKLSSERINAHYLLAKG